MTFSGDLAAFNARVLQRQRDAFNACAEEVQRSVVEGSEITSAPGQPVDTGILKGSWIPAYTGQWEWQTTTNVDYAPAQEEGIGPHGPMQVRSAVGGHHSVAMTRNGWQRIAEAVAARLVSR